MQAVAVSTAVVYPPHERVAMLYFPVVCALAILRGAPVATACLVLFVPVLWAALCVVESAYTAPWSRVTRQYLSLAMILIGYRSLDLVPGGHSFASEAWIGWDRTLLGGLGLRPGIEALGAAGPYLLETVYLLLYAIPCAALTVVWLLGYGRNAKRLLLMIFAGTFAVYVLLPVFSVPSPRLTFPDADLPGITVLPRLINTWLLDHYDSTTGVFPSGHVAVAFACAFGLLSAMRERRAVWVTAMGVAVLVHAATIYGRYHYALDGLASFFIVFAVWAITEKYWRLVS